jgi:hypothetical protein
MPNIQAIAWRALKPDRLLAATLAGSRREIQG